MIRITVWLPDIIINNKTTESFFQSSVHIHLQSNTYEGPAAAQTTYYIWFLVLLVLKSSAELYLAMLCMSFNMFTTACSCQPPWSSKWGPAPYLPHQSQQAVL